MDPGFLPVVSSRPSWAALAGGGAAGGCGRDGAAMARAAARESVTIAGLPERVAVARAFALGGAGPAAPGG